MEKVVKENIGAFMAAKMAKNWQYEEKKKT